MPVEKKKKDWFRVRGYLHLTNRLKTSDRPAVYKYVSNPRLVQKHRFLPLILREFRTRRYRFSEELGRHSHKVVDDRGQVVSNKKIRPIMYATHIDSNVYSFYAQQILQPKYEAVLKQDDVLNESVTAYRQLKSAEKLRFKYNVDFAKEVFDEIKRRGDCGVLALDIKNFFPSLDHSLLKRTWCKILDKNSLPKDHYNIFKAVTNYSYFYYDDLRKKYRGHLDEKKIAQLRNKGKHQFFENYQDFQDSGIQVYKNPKDKEGKIRGIPQGLPISALLANMYMLPFDQRIIEELVEGRACYYRRYSDDLVVICDATELDQVEEIVLQEIEKLNLVISKEKTEKFHFYSTKQGLHCAKLVGDQTIPNSYLQYLGFDFYGDKTLIKSSNLSAFYREMKGSISRKRKRIEAVQIKNLTSDEIIFKRKIYRLYSYKGVKSRQLIKRKELNWNGRMIPSTVERKYRGNFIKYAYRSSERMEAPEIKRQVRRHMRILKNYMAEMDLNSSS